MSQTQGGPELRVTDVPVSPDATELIVAQTMPAMRALGACRLRCRLVALEPAGGRLIGEYTFDHTPTER